MKNKERSRFTNILINSVGVALFIIACIVICIYLSPYLETLLKKPDTIREIAEEKGVVAIPIFLLLQVLQIVVAVIPGEALEVGAGAAFGWFGGFLLSELGIMLGTVLIFAVTRKLGKRFVESITDGKRIKRFEKLDKSPRRDRIIFLIFFIPGLPKDILTYAAAFFDIGLLKFLVITMTARIPSVISSTLAADFLINGNYITSAVIFIITAVISALCFLLSEKILAKIEKTK